MKYILLISTLMFSAGSWAEWTLVAEDVYGDEYYVDSIRQVNDVVYYWQMTDYLEPDVTGAVSTMSTKSYFKADCETMRSMKLSFSIYEVPMAEGLARATSNLTPDMQQWEYVQPSSLGEIILEAVCARARAR